MQALLTTVTPFVQEDFEPSPIEDSLISKCKVLVVGAGGLGCELLKDLVLSRFTDIHVIDMDTIELSNLNRQFLFRSFAVRGIECSRTEDIGRPKAQVAAAFITKRLGVEITAHFCKIQDKDEEFYRSFDLVICGLDSIAARRWVNGMLCKLVEFHEDGSLDPSTVIPIIDGGTEGFKGNVRVIIPFVTSCFECSLDLFPPATSFPLCTIANTPRLPEHCIEWAAILEWPRIYPEESLDADNPVHIDLVLKLAQERAVLFNITSVTRRLVIGVVKHVIPAIPSTNAIISACCALEAVKMVTKTSRFLDNYLLYNGTESAYSYAYANERNHDCIVCSKKEMQILVSPSSTLKMLMDQLLEDKNIGFIITDP